MLSRFSHLGDKKPGKRRLTTMKKWKVPRYLPDILKQYAEMEHKPDRLYHVPIYHDSWCRLLAGKGQCNCNPVVGKPSPEQ